MYVSGEPLDSLKSLSCGVLLWKVCDLGEYKITTVWSYGITTRTVTHIGLLYHLKKCFCLF